MAKFTHLPKLMQDAMSALKALNNTPPEMAIQVVLGVANLATQSHYNVDTEYYHLTPISLFLLNLSPTGATKSTNFKELMTGINRFEEEERIRLKDEKQRYAIEKKVYEIKEKAYVTEQVTGKSPVVVTTPTAQKQKIKDFSNLLKGNLTALRESENNTDGSPKMPKPIQTAKYVISKGTVNGIVEQLKSQSMVGLFSGEAGEFFNSHSFQGGNDTSKSIEMAAALTSMWDGSNIEKLTGVEQTTLFSRRVAMCLLLQETTIRKFLSNPQYADQGFVHRILMTQCQYFDTPDYDCSDANMKRISNERAKLSPFHQRIYELISKPFTIKEGTDFELVLETLKCSRDAMRALDVFGNKTKARKQTDLKAIIPFAGRSHEHALRIAATLAAFEKQDEITLENVKAAVELMEFYFDQRKTLEVDADAKNGAQLELALKLVTQMKETKFDGTLREFRQVAKFGYRKFDEEQRMKTIKEMVATGDVELYETDAANGCKVTKIRCV